MHEKQRITTPVSEVPVCHPAIFWDDASGTFNYVTTGTGADYVAEYNTAAAHSGVEGIHLETRTTDPAADDYVSIVKRLWLPPTQLITLEFLWSIPNYPSEAYFFAILHWYDGAFHRTAQLRFSFTTGDVHYYDDEAGWTPITAFDFANQTNTWNHVIFALNHRLNMYQFCSLNNQVWDGRAAPIRSAVQVERPRLYLEFMLETRGAAKRYMNIDHVLVSPSNP